jgi:hypothetical protein
MIYFCILNNNMISTCGPDGASGIGASNERPTPNVRNKKAQNPKISDFRKKLN